MPPKGTNSKKEAGRAKKAENEVKKKETAAAEKERQESAKWDDGSKSTKAKDSKEEKRRAEAARKAENAKLLAEEEASLPKVKSGTGPKSKKPSKSQIPAGPGAIAAGGGLGEDQGGGKEQRDEEMDRVVESFHATGLDDALELLEVVNAKTDKASVGQQAAGLERHPERRFKPAFEAYQERELPRLKQDHPGLRLQQYKDLLYKQFQKSPENPFNQTVVSYDATKAEKLEALRKKQEEVEERLREKMVGSE